MNTVLRVKNRMVISLLLVYPGDRVIDWELRLPAAAQHHERVLYRVSLA